jgi:surfactin synthase thioesterase subunit
MGATRVMGSGFLDFSDCGGVEDRRRATHTRETSHHSVEDHSFLNHSFSVLSLDMHTYEWLSVRLPTLRADQSIIRDWRVASSIFLGDTVPKA